MSEVLPTEEDLTVHIEKKILHVFETYPTISPSMLQITLGSCIPTAFWQPILDKLINDGKLFRYAKRVTTPSGRLNTATILSSIEPPPDIEAN